MQIPALSSNESFLPLGPLAAPDRQPGDSSSARKTTPFISSTSSQAKVELGRSTRSPAASSAAHHMATFQLTAAALSGKRLAPTADSKFLPFESGLWSHCNLSMK